MAKENFNGYCLSCKEKVDVSDGKYRVTANGKGQLVGTCPNDSNHKVYKITAKR